MEEVSIVVSDDKDNENKMIETDGLELPVEFEVNHKENESILMPPPKDAKKRGRPRKSDQTLTIDQPKQGIRRSERLEV